MVNAYFVLNDKQFSTHKRNTGRRILIHKL